MVKERMDPIFPVGFIAHHALKSLWGICLKRSNTIISPKQHAISPTNYEILEIQLMIARKSYQKKNGSSLT
jgi:hypothetical protein